MTTYYGESFTYKDTTVSVSNCTTQEQARNRIIHMLTLSNYKLPKWYQFWRWFEEVPDYIKEGLNKQ